MQKGCQATRQGTPSAYGHDRRPEATRREREREEREEEEEESM